MDFMSTSPLLVAAALPVLGVDSVLDLSVVAPRDASVGAAGSVGGVSVLESVDLSPEPVSWASPREALYLRGLPISTPRSSTFPRTGRFSPGNFARTRI